MQSFSLMEEEDSFYAENKFSTFGELGENIQKYVLSYQSKIEHSQQSKDLSQMKKFIEQYPEYKKMSQNVSKHVAIVDELSKIVNRNCLLHLSEVEQSIVEAVGQKISSDFFNLERILESLPLELKIKLLMLFYVSFKSQNHSSFPLIGQKIKHHLILLTKDEVRVAIYFGF